VSVPVEVVSAAAARAQSAARMRVYFILYGVYFSGECVSGQIELK